MTEEKRLFFENLYQEQFFKLRYYAYAALNDWDRAEEVTQDVFLTAWRKIDQLVSSPNPQGWLVQTMKYTLKNVQRNDCIQARLFLSVVDPEKLRTENAIESTMEVENLYRTFLTQEEYHLLCRFVLEKATYKELSQELSINIWACQKRMQRILKKCRDYFGKNL